MDTTDRPALGSGDLTGLRGVATDDELAVIFSRLLEIVQVLEPFARQVAPDDPVNAAISDVKRMAAAGLQFHRPPAPQLPEALRHVRADLQRLGVTSSEARRAIARELVDLYRETERLPSDEAILAVLARHLGGVAEARSVMLRWTSRPTSTRQ